MPPQDDRAPVFTPGQALALFGGAVILMIPASALVLAVGLAGVLVVQIVCVGGLPVVAARVRFGSAAWAALGIRRASARELLGAACIGLGFWFVNLVLAAPLVEWLGGEQEIASLGELVAEAPAWLAVLGLAVVPAVCEEILVRGVVTRALAPALGRLAAILLSAALFSLLHFSLARLVPTALFGVVLAYTVLQTGSLLPGMLMHALNNGVALALTTGALEPVLEVMLAQPAAFLVGALATCTVGASLIQTAREGVK